MGMNTASMYRGGTKKPSKKQRSEGRGALRSSGEGKTDEETPKMREMKQMNCKERRINKIWCY